MKAYPTYIDSGASWIGDIPTHWTARKIKTLFRIKKEIAGKDGYDVLSITQQGIKIKDVESNEGQIAQSYTNYQLLNVGEFAMNHMDLLTGWVDISPFNGVTSPDYRVFVRSEENASSKYLLYTLQTCYTRKLFYGLAQGVSSIGRCRLQASKFKNFVFPLPPTLEEQNAIVAYLDKKCAEIDELVSRRQAIIERLKELKQSIIAEAVTKGLNPDVPMKESGIDWLGEVPQHWEKYRTPSILKVTSKAGTDSDELLSVYLDRGVIKHSESDGMQVHKPSKDMSAYQKVLPGNFVCNNQQAWRGSVGVSEHEGRISPAYIIFNLSSKLEPKFANYFFRSQAWNPSFVYSSKGVGSIQRNLYLPWLRQHYCYLPSTEEQQAIVTYLDKKCAEIDELVARQEQIIEKLKELKTSTIAHVVTGKVDVRDAI